MKYLKEHLIAVLIAVLCLLFLLGEILHLEQLVLCSRVLIFPVLILFYVQKVKKQKLFFVLFLSFFAFAEFVRFFVLNFGMTETHEDIISHAGTFSYILAHSSLLILIISSIKIRNLYKRFPLHCMVLVPFGLYLVYALDNIISYNGTASMSNAAYILLTIYNITVVLILICSLLGYLYRETRKSLMLFIACSCLVFSELIQTAYYFMAREGLLGLVYTALLSSGFFMFYIFMTFINKTDYDYKFVNKENKWLTNNKNI